MFNKLTIVATLVLTAVAFVSVVWAYWRTKQKLFLLFLLAYLCVVVPMVNSFFFPQSFTTMTGEVIRKPVFYVNRILQLLHYCFLIAAFLYGAKKQAPSSSRS
jgi:hypothetical protein